MYFTFLYICLFADLYFRSLFLQTSFSKPKISDQTIQPIILMSFANIEELTESHTYILRIIEMPLLIPKRKKKHLLLTGIVSR